MKNKVKYFTFPPSYVNISDSVNIFNNNVYVNVNKVYVHYFSSEMHVNSHLAVPNVSLDKCVPEFRNEDFLIKTNHFVFSFHLLSPLSNTQEMFFMDEYLTLTCFRE